MRGRPSTRRIAIKKNSLPTRVFWWLLLRELQPHTVVIRIRGCSNSRSPLWGHDVAIRLTDSFDMAIPLKASQIHKCIISPTKYLESIYDRQGPFLPKTLHKCEMKQVPCPENLEYKISHQVHRINIRQTGPFLPKTLNEFSTRKRNRCPVPKSNETRSSCRSTELPC